MKDVCAAGHDDLPRHAHVDELDPEWLAVQARHVQEAYAQGIDPHERLPHSSELEESLRDRAEEMIAAYARGEDPLKEPRAGKSGKSK